MGARRMTVAHPVAGSFGVYAEMYVHPWAGFAMRYSYWLAQVIATGSEVVAASIYCQHWFPSVPSWMWIAGFSAALVYVNARSVAKSVRRRPRDRGRSEGFRASPRFRIDQGVAGRQRRGRGTQTTLSRQGRSAHAAGERARRIRRRGRTRIRQDQNRSVVRR